MRSLFTGGLRVLEQSPDGLLHDAQPRASIGVAAAQIGADGQPLVEPGAFFCDGNYSLAINSWNSLTGVAVTLRLRWLSADGRTTDSEFVHVPNTNRTKATSLFPLGVGFALNVTVFASTGTPLIGQTFIQVQIVRGLTGALLPVATLLQDYTTAVQAVAWPGSPIRSSIEGGGFARNITGTTPAAGAEMSETVPTGARWKLRTLASTLATAVGGGTRTPQLILDTGVNVFAIAVNPNGIAASLNGIFTFAEGLVLATLAASNWYGAPIPQNLSLLAGDRIRSSTPGLAAGDQWTAPNYVVDEFIEAAA